MKLLDFGIAKLLRVGPEQVTAPESVSRTPAATPPSMQRQLEGGPDRIVLKPLEKEPERRYRGGLPVLARGSRRYLGGKFLLRHRGWALGTLALTIGLATGSVLLGFWAVFFALLFFVLLGLCYFSVRLEGAERKPAYNMALFFALAATAAGLFFAFTRATLRIAECGCSVIEVAVALTGVFLIGVGAGAGRPLSSRPLNLTVLSLASVLGGFSVAWFINDRWLRVDFGALLALTPFAAHWATARFFSHVLPEKTVRNEDALLCLKCESEIPAGDASCRKCGWTYR